MPPRRPHGKWLVVDKDQHIPRMNFVLGLILMDKKEYGESAKCFRKYLELAPNANDAAVVRQQLPKIEEMAAAALEAGAASVI